MLSKLFDVITFDGNYHCFATLKILNDSTFIANTRQFLKYILSDVSEANGNFILMQSRDATIVFEKKFFQIK